MPHFSEKSEVNLAQCHNDLQIIFNEVIKHVDCSVLCGQRGEKDQNEAYRSGKSRLEFPQSKHNKVPAMAVDVVPYPIDWNNNERFIRFGEFVLGVASTLYDLNMIENKISWGGDWQKFKDMPHFEI